MGLVMTEIGTNTILFDLFAKSLKYKNATYSRVVVSSYIYHITQRGNYRQIFSRMTKIDYVIFPGLMSTVRNIIYHYLPIA